ncbi:MAG: 1-phosphofructokinase [Subtercola sp.]|nr:1-phosphofructokinase [Subtercola sp.]
MILTVTANPSIDVTLTVDTLVVGEVNRATSVRRDPAGKGVNVSRALAQNGVATTAILPADAVNGYELERMLAAHSITSVSTIIAHAIRTNITVVDGLGTTKLNEPGPQVSATELARLMALITEQLKLGPEWLVGSGSLPPGIPDHFYSDLAELAAGFGVPFAVDTSGDALDVTARSGTATLLKPNLEELEELSGRRLTTVGDVVEAARRFLTLAGSAMLVSLDADGALLVSENDFWWAGSEPVTPVSTVGAGDSALAGYLSVTDGTFPARLSAAVAWGAAAVQLPGSQAPSPADIHPETVRLIHTPPLTTPLGELTLWLQARP